MDTSVFDEVGVIAWAIPVMVLVVSGLAAYAFWWAASSSKRSERMTRLADGFKGVQVREVSLGDRVSDKVTGFEGVVTGVANYISGCRQCCVAPPAKDGGFRDSQWFDDDRLTVVAPQAVSLKERRRDGGPQSNPAPIR